ncbi:hypothetical protein ACXIU6_22550 [Vibrio parahaemolyticus]
MTKFRVFLFLFIPFIAGAFVGIRFPSLDVEQQKEMVGFIADFSQSGLFNIVAPIAVLIFAIYVFIYGQVPRELRGARKLLLFWLPGVAFSCSIPFFTALLGFLVAYKGELETTKLAVITVVGFVYSVVFFVGMLLPAFEGVYPKDVGQKRKVYSLLVVSLGIVALWQYFT